MKLRYTLLNALFAFIILLPISSNAQVDVFPQAEGGFESGASFASNNWITTTTGNNKWYVGTATFFSGARAAYIDKNATLGTVNSYNMNQAAVSHLYRDFTIPNGATNVTLTFKWRCAGELTSGTYYDFLRAYVVPTSTTPTAGTELASGQLGGQLQGQATTYQTATYTLTGVAGTTQRLVFSWVNDGSLGNQPPAAIDAITLTYIPAAGCAGTPNTGNIAATGNVVNFCGSATTTLTLNSASIGTGISYQWQYFDGTLWQPIGTNATTLAITNLITTTQYRTVTTCSNSGLTATATPITITVNPLPIVNLSTTDTFICGSGNSVTVTASGTASSYSWSPSVGLNTTTGPTVIATPPGTGKAYTVTGQLGTCTDSKMVSVNVVTPPTLTTTATPSTICSGGNTQLATSQFVGGNYQVYSIAPYTLTPAAQTVALDQSVSPPQGDLDDGRSGAIPLPFTFNFYGVGYTSMFMGTNGVVGFTGAGFQNGIDAQSIPDPMNPNNVIGLFWHDLTMVASGTVTYGTTGLAPNRKFVITYTNVPGYGAPGTNNSGQVVLHETSNWIDVIVTSSTSSDFKTIGIENLGATEALAAPGRNATSWTVVPAAPEAYRFATTNHTYTWTPTANLSNPGIWNPQATNLTAPVTYTVNIQNSVTKCISTGTAAVTVNPLPTATISAGTSPICNGQTSTITFTGTPGATVTYNINGGSPLTVTLNAGGTFVLTTAPLSINSTFNLVSALSAQNCPQTLTGSATINVTPRPTATIAGSQVICNGTTGYIQLNPLVGTAPWTITYTDNNAIPYTQIISGSSVIGHTPSATTTYTITSMHDANCTSIAGDWSGTATITVNPRPTASLSLAAPAICEGDNTNLVVTFTGTAPYNFEIFDGTNNLPYTGITANPYNIPVNPTMATTYSLNYVQDANCFGQLSDLGAPVTLNYNIRPTASISGDNTICNGNNTPITLNLTGAGPWDINYNDGTGNIPITGIAASTYTFNVTPSTNTTYTLATVSDINCSAVASGMTGSAVIIVNQLPAITTPPANENRCLGDFATFTATATGTGITYQWLENGSPLTDNAVYAGSLTNTLTINDLTGLNGNTYQLVASGTCSPAATSTAATLNVSATNTWTGAVSTLWSVPANWGCGILPNQYTNVVIPAVANLPEVDIPTAICNSLSISAGTSVTFINTGNALEVKADINGAGTFDGSLGRVILSGNATQTIPGVTYGNLDVDGGSTKNFAGNATVTNNLNLLDGYIVLGANDLALGQTASVTNSGAQSFVVTDGTGVVIGQNMGTGANTGNVMFPVGSDASSYTPITIANTGVLDNINVRVITGVWDTYNGETPNGILQIANAVDKTWFINEDVVGGSNATVTPQWNSTDELAVFNNANCQVSHYNTTTNHWESSTMSPAAGSGPFTQTVSGVLSFSPFGVGSEGSPLPLDLISFTGELFKDDARLTWVTVNEFDMVNFQVERSIDKGKTFQTISVLPVEGNNKNGNNIYKHVDENVRKLKADKLFYRLKMKQGNGKYKYSSMVTLNVDSKIAKGMLDAYPNPVDGNIVYVRMATDNKEDVSIMVTDMAGKVLSTTNYKAATYLSDAVPVDITTLAQGMYMLRVVDASNKTIDVLKFNRQ